MSFRENRGLFLKAKIKNRRKNLTRNGCRDLSVVQLMRNKILVPPHSQEPGGFMGQRKGHRGTWSHLCPAARVGQRWREGLMSSNSLDSLHALDESRVGIPLLWIPGKLGTSTLGCSPKAHPHIPHMSFVCRHKVITQMLHS